MKKIIKKINICSLVLFTTYVFACDACRLQQPNVTRNLTHGTGPESNWDWFIIIIVILITLVALGYSVKYLISPGEKEESHIKYSVLPHQNEIL
ncbi:hypothetical protein CHRYSEOSP005_30250 [Chryseobacterium sp. Alg-005]|uniref:hypothetical protein n=1 Tax=Chryseobacterium sp. Alg-005 TaxID=3159516 RepID=UPI0035559D6C